MNDTCLIELLVAGGEILKGGNFSVLIKPGDLMFTVTLCQTNFVLSLLLHRRENSLI